MKKTFLIITAMLVLTSMSKSVAQDDPTPIGFKLRRTRNLIKVYQDNPDKPRTPNLTIYNYWTSGYFFVVDDDNVEFNGTKYIRLSIPSGNRDFRIATPWKKNSDYIDSDDFNCYLYITQADFITYSIDEFPKYSGRWVLTGLSIPFKIRPSVGTHASSLYNSNFNVGTFFGIRVNSRNKAGVSLGGMFGVASQDQNSSTNSAIIDNSSQTISAVNYGLGLIVDVAKKFQIGGIIGWDHGYGDLSKSYIYQHKSWFALSLNYNFLDFGGKKGATVTNE